jgi:hypothetical protein
MAEDIRFLELESVRRFLEHDTNQNEITVSQSQRSNPTVILQNDPFKFLQFVIFLFLLVYALIVFVFAFLRRRDMQIKESTITQRSKYAKYFLYKHFKRIFSH